MNHSSGGSATSSILEPTTTILSSNNGAAAFAVAATASGPAQLMTPPDVVSAESAVSLIAQAKTTLISGGNWWAVNVSGITYYMRGDTKIEASGPVVLSNIDSLYIQSGAVVSGATISGNWPHVYVWSGGTLENSSEVNGYIYISAGGVSLSN